MLKYLDTLYKKHASEHTLSELFAYRKVVFIILKVHVSYGQVEMILQALEYETGKFSDRYMCL